MNGNSKDSKMSRKEREFQARRQEILESATRLFARQGFHGTSMNEIAKEAEFSTGSLYNFFKNKEELYFSLLQEKISSMESSINNVYEDSGSIEEKLKRFADTILEYFDKERDFFRIFSEQRTTFENTSKGMLADLIHDQYTSYLVKMVKLMEQGVKEGLLKPLNPAELALIFGGILNTFIVISLNLPGAESIKEKGPLVLDIFFSGARR